MTDDDLRARLRHADPAADLTPLAPDQLDRLLEKTMYFPVRRFVLLAAAALVLIATAGVSWAATRPSHHPAPVAAASSPSPGFVRLTASGAQGKCMAPSASGLASKADFAFAGTVTDMAGNMVTLTVTRVYKGAATGTVELNQMGDSSEQLMGTGKFTEGGRYLVASADGAVMICGYSGEADAPGLQELYDQAF